jgi:hypothetical protein
LDLSYSFTSNELSVLKQQQFLNYFVIKKLYYPRRRRRRGYKFIISTINNMFKKLLPVLNSFPGWLEFQVPAAARDNKVKL